MARGKLFVKYDIFVVKRMAKRIGYGKCYYKKVWSRKKQRLTWQRGCKGRIRVYVSPNGGKAIELCELHYKEVMETEKMLNSKKKG